MKKYLIGNEELSRKEIVVEALELVTAYEEAIKELKEGTEKPEILFAKMVENPGSLDATQWTETDFGDWIFAEYNVDGDDLYVQGMFVLFSEYLERNTVKG